MAQSAAEPLKTARLEFPDNERARLFYETAMDRLGRLPGVATVAVTSFAFKQPVFVGDLVSFYADIVKTGNTSITVEVEVADSGRGIAPQDLTRVFEPFLTSSVNVSPVSFCDSVVRGSSLRNGSTRANSCSASPSGWQTLLRWLLVP